MPPRKQATADAPPMDGQTAWTRADEEAALTHGQPRDPLPASEGVAGNGDDLERRRLSIGLQAPDTSSAGGKRKGPRKPRTPARTVCYVEKLMSRFTLAQRKAMYAMLSSVTEATLTDEGAKP